MTQCFLKSDRRQCQSEVEVGSPQQVCLTSEKDSERARVQGPGLRPPIPEPHQSPSPLAHGAESGRVPCPLWFTSLVAITLFKIDVSGSFSLIKGRIRGDMISCLCRIYVSMAILGKWETTGKTKRGSLCSRASDTAGSGWAYHLKI